MAVNRYLSSCGMVTTVVINIVACEGKALIVAEFKQSDTTSRSCSVI